MTVPNASFECPICREPHLVSLANLRSNEDLVERQFLLRGKYQLLARVGDESGMGSVFRARNIRLDRIVAVKRMNPEFSACPVMVERFENEARAVIRIEHPNICDVFDVDFDPSVGHFLVMEWLPGASLRSLLKVCGRVPVRDAIRLICALLQGLAATHRADIVHRDIKLENVFVVTREPLKAPLGSLLDRVGVKLLDFGIARMSTDPNALTGHGPMTVNYAAPEQALLPASVGPPADLWAVGIILYELIAGTRPFSDTNPGVAPWQVVAFRHDAVPTPLHQRAEGVPIELSQIVERCLAYAPKDRHASAEALAAALQQVSTVSPNASTAPASPNLDGPTTPISRPAPTRRAVPMTLIVSVAALVIAFGVRELLKAKGRGPAVAAVTVSEPRSPTPDTSIKSPSGDPTTIVAPVDHTSPTEPPITPPSLKNPAQPPVVPPEPVTTLAPPHEEPPTTPSIPAKATPSKRPAPADLCVVDWPYVMDPRHQKRTASTDVEVNIMVTGPCKRAIVEIDGNYAGETPWRGYLPAGRHRLDLTVSAHIAPFHGNVEIPVGPSHTVKKRLAQR